MASWLSVPKRSGGEDCRFVDRGENVCKAGEIIADDFFVNIHHSWKALCNFLCMLYVCTYVCSQYCTEYHTYILLMAYASTY